MYQSIFYTKVYMCSMTITVHVGFHVGLYLNAAKHCNQGVMIANVIGL